MDGITFDSAREAHRWSELKMLERGKVISALSRQVTFPLVVNGVLVGSYRADFVYVDETGHLTVEDAKSPPTAKNPTYRLKRKLMAACHNIEIVEV